MRDAKVHDLPRIHRWLGGIALLAAWLACAAAAAQNPSTDVSFAISQFEPAPGPLNFFAIEGPEIGDDMKPSVGLMLTYQHRPFVIMNCTSDGACGDDVKDEGQGGEVGTIDLVENLITADLLGSFNFLDRFQVGLALPINVWQRGDTYDIVPEDGPDQYGNQWLRNAGKPYEDFGVLGDLRLHLKVRIVGDERENGFVFSGSVIPTLPLAEWAGYSSGYAGDGFLTVTAPKLMVHYRYGGLRVALNASAVWREKSEFFSVETGHTLRYGGAIGYAIIPEVELIGEIYGSKSLVSENFTDMESAPLLFLGGGRFKVGDFLINVAAGGGIISGAGVPQFQIVTGAAWAPEAAEDEGPKFNEWDVDGDGIDNDADACPDVPEDLDGFQDEDGCPDEDNDQDGIQDGYDSCPNEPEDNDGFRDDDGCPDLDHDEDGVKEPDDKCPEVAEDYDEFEDEDGCPEEDNDKDGFLDAEDNCPNLPEDKDGFEDEDGCPDLDNDQDGVPDDQDKCPNKAETLNGYKDDDGCPDRGKALVVVTEEKIEIKQKIQFETDSDAITGEKSFEVLDIVSKILAGNTAIRVSIEGHTDNRGKIDHNRDLSKRRAESVKRYLAEHGVAADRLETVGWGPDQPIASNKTKRGREANRRVEFVIIRPQKTAIVPETPEDEGGAEMDFTAGEDAGDAEAEMDFTIEEDEGGGGEADMDFTAE